MVQELTQMIIQGKGVKETSKALSKRLDADYKNCVRLIHTEHSYFMEISSQKAYVECDVDKYEILATLDKRTSKICQDLDGEVFNVKDAVVGVNMPPFH
jgi:SPP1 gp7 family putative phage head morphogenesis protein